MGMYTELIFGARFKEDTPKSIIDTLKYLVGQIDELENPAIELGRNPLMMGSYSFGVHKPVADLFYDDIARAWAISTRGNIKNYDGDIEIFLEWIKPYIDSGSGNRDLYAITIYEDEETPTLYFKYDE